MNNLEKCKYCGADAKITDSGGTGIIMCSNYCTEVLHHDALLYGGHWRSKKQAIKNWNIVNKIE